MYISLLSHGESLCSVGPSIPVGTVLLLYWTPDASRSGSYKITLVYLFIYLLFIIIRTPSGVLMKPPPSVCLSVRLSVPKVLILPIIRFS